MEIIRGFQHIPNLKLALGFFDGVHLGHQAVLAKANAVVTFKNHPLCTLKGLEPKYILPREDVYHFFNVDYVVELDFDNIANMTAAQYLKMLIKYFEPKAIITGFNHHFGSDKMGTKFLSKQKDFEYLEIPPAKINNEIISSSAIRRYIVNGEIEKANTMLGKNFYACGIVIKGEQLGRTIGFPTANIEWRKDIIEPKYGVYKVEVELLSGDKYKGIANFGIRPTVSDKFQSRLEVYLKDFSGNLYGQKIKVNFLSMIREEKKFNNLDELKEQIKLDIKKAE